MELFDVIIIGGGITGAAIARDAAMRNLKVLLLEKQDFGSGASGTCMGMMGGPVGIPNDLDFAEMNAQEVHILKKIATPFIDSRPFLSLVFSEEDYEQQKKSFDIFSNIITRHGEKKPIFIDKNDVLKIDPRFTDYIYGAFYFTEYELDVFRLIISNLLSARKYGAKLLNYKEVVSINVKKEKNLSITVRDSLSGKISTYYGKIIINATGAWAPKIADLLGISIKMRPTKGTIIIADGHVSNIGFQFIGLDANFKEVTLHRNTSLLGPTYDDYFDDPESLEVTETEINLILESVRQVLPSIVNERLLRAMTGLRPLPYAWGMPPSKVPRPIKIIDHEKHGADGFITVIGGNFTIHRLMAEQAVDYIMNKLNKKKISCKTHIVPLLKFVSQPKFEKYHRKYKLPKAVIEPLYHRHPENFEKILESTIIDKSGRNLICTCESIIKAEIDYIIKNEWIRVLNDLRRRTRIGFGPCQGTFCIHKAIFSLYENAKNYTQKELMMQLRDFLEKRWHGIHPVLEPNQLSMHELGLSIFNNLLSQYRIKLMKEK